MNYGEIYECNDDFDVYICEMGRLVINKGTRLKIDDFQCNTSSIHTVILNEKIKIPKYIINTYFERIHTEN